jgi:excisionase family DNA binding protein
MSVRVAARELDISERTVWRYVASGVLRSTRFGRTVRVLSEDVYRRAQLGEDVTA